MRLNIESPAPRETAGPTGSAHPNSIDEVRDAASAGAIAYRLLCAGNAERKRLRAAGGACQRAARRLRQVLAPVALAAGLLGVPLAGAADAADPVFEAAPSPFGDADVGTFSRPALADLDGDGDLDALVGAGNRAIFYENTGTATNPAFGGHTESPFGLVLPKIQHTSPALADLDGDGDLDLLVGSFSIEEHGLRYFENTGTATAPAFSPPVLNPFGIASDDFRRTSPALVDLDGDGDLDLLRCIRVRGREELDWIDLFFSENTGTANAPAFAPETENPFGFVRFLAEEGHAVMAVADLDRDGDLDLLLGREDGRTRFFRNTGSPTAPAFADGIDNPFGLPVVRNRAAPAIGDLDGDGDLDALFGFQDGTPAFFENVVSLPSFGIGDVGAHANPELADLDGDGDVDALIGNADGKSLFFENVGTADAPWFAPPMHDPFGLTDVGYGAAPALADLDGDGDLDALIGNDDGDSLFFENTGTPSAPAFRSARRNPFGLADVGFAAAPTLADVDDDGDLDALIGDVNGRTRFFENRGDATAPAFAAPTTNPFGLVTAESEAKPEFADRDRDGDLDAFIGVASGDTVYFENIGTAAAPAFAAPVTNPFGLVDVGRFASPDLADLDGDGDLDALIGNQDGDSVLFENDTPFGCTPTPAVGCTDGFEKGSLVVSEKKAGKEKLVAILKKGPAIAQAEFGEPSDATGTAWALCLYDDTGALVEELMVDRAGDTCAGKPCWKPLGGDPPAGKGHVYRDKDAGSSGVQVMKLKGGDAGKSVLHVKAGNNTKRGQASLPTGIADTLAATGSVEIQLHGDNGACWGTALHRIVASPGRFKAK